MTMTINKLPASPTMGGAGDMSDVVRQAAEASAALQPILSVFTQPTDPDAMPYRIAYGVVAGANADGLFDANGAPALAAPLSPPNIDALVMYAQAANDRANDKMLSQKATDAYTSTKQRVDDYVKAQLKAIDDFKVKVENALNKGVFAKIFGWISKHLAPVLTVLSLVLAAGATLATGGAAAPLLVMAVLNLAGTALQAGGISISEKLSALIGKALTAVGVPKETAQKIGNAMGGYLTMIVPGMIMLDPAAMGRLFCGVGELCGADKNTAQLLQQIGSLVGTVVCAAVNAVLSLGPGACGSLASAASRIADVSKYAQIGVTAGTGVVGMGAGASNIVVAQAQKGVEMAEADKRLIQALTDDVRQCLDQVQDTIRRSFDHVMANSKASAEMVANHVEAMTERASQPIPA
jgi:hypothetical protein